MLNFKNIFLIFFLHNIYCFSQPNLVPNPSFEDTISCPNNTSQIYYANSWFAAGHGNNSSTDYFNKCATVWYVSVPSNLGYQLPRTGNAYAGFYLTGPSANYREYAEIQLLDTLIIGKKYCVEFYVSLLDNAMAVDAVGAYFTKDSLFVNSPNTLLPYTPQISNPIGNILSDTVNWIKVSGTFTADSLYRFLTIGNFKDDANTNDTVSVKSDSYYYLEDVSVYLCDSTGIGELQQNISVNIFPNPTGGIVNFSCSEKVEEIFIADIIGQRVCTLPRPSERKIDISSFSQGVYFLNVSTEKGMVVKKIIKE